MVGGVSSSAGHSEPVERQDVRQTAPGSKGFNEEANESPAEKASEAKHGEGGWTA